MVKLSKLCLSPVENTSERRRSPGLAAERWRKESSGARTTFSPQGVSALISPCHGSGIPHRVGRYRWDERAGSSLYVPGDGSTGKSCREDALTPEFQHSSYQAQPRAVINQELSNPPFPHHPPRRGGPDPILAGTELLLSLTPNTWLFDLWDTAWAGWDGDKDIPCGLSLAMCAVWDAVVSQWQQQQLC